MSERKTYFVDVIVPLGIPRYFTYRVPVEWNDAVQRGVRVIVPFGTKKKYTALIYKIHETPPKAYQAKYIDGILDEMPIVLPVQFKFWDWIQDYYMCNPGDVFNAALPGSFRLASETKVYLHPDYERDQVLTDEEVLIVDALELQEQLTLDEISQILQIKTVQPAISRMIQKRIIIVEEELRNKYKPKILAHVAFGEGLDMDAASAIIQQLEGDSRAEKQLDLFLRFLSLLKQQQRNDIEKKTLLGEEFSDSPLKSLEKKGILSIFDKIVSRLDEEEAKELREDTLTEHQNTALKEIDEAHQKNDVVLLHGVTGSGKTQVYIERIKEALDAGQQVLYLLPEIALTTQLIQRLQQYFDHKVGVYHSKFNPNERVEIWNKVLQNHSDYRLIVGARSSLFLPYRNLGLIIVDEEHENTFKQFDPAPRYNARDASVVLAMLHKAKVILGSATPSIESYYNAKSGKYGLVEMKERFSGVMMPEVLVADIKEARKRKEMQTHFSKFLLDYIDETLKNGEQIILFQNKRGYTPFWMCEMCNWTPNCKQCDVSLTYHKGIHKLNCHYCGYTIQPPVRCEACGSNKLKMMGFGTEKVEDELQILLGEKVVIQRLDLDVTRSKTAHARILEDFESKRIDILVGTQMVTKGLDFDNVGLVGILSADDLLRFPDFRAFERSFQLMEQVAGRTGRQKKRGKVVIQSGEPNHWIIQKVIAHDYVGMYTQEIIERRNFQYPPFYKLIVLTLKHRDKNQLLTGSTALAKSLRSVFRDRILGPEEPLVGRVRNFYLRQIIIKFEAEASRKKVKEILAEKLDEFQTDRKYKSIIVNIDVDPL